MTSGLETRRFRPLADYVAFHARRTPARIAVVDGGDSITYAILDRDLRHTVAFLAGLGLARGSVVAVGHDAVYGQLLLILGFECLGMVVGQFRPCESTESDCLVRQSALVAVSQSATVRGPRRTLQLNLANLRADLSANQEKAPDYPVMPASADEPLLLVRTSGSTGPPKWMHLTRRQLDMRIRHRSRLMRLNRDARVLRTLPLRVAGMYYALAATFRLGATLVEPSPPTFRQTMADHRVTHATCLPLQLDMMIRDLPDDAVALSGLSVFVIGARLGTALRQRALDCLCGRIVNIYSSNEAGSVCAMDADGSGAILPGVAVEVVDERGRPVPPETVGRLRIKGISVATGYVDEALATTRPFASDWFETEDLGAITRAGRLRVLGRRDDVVNVGGIKLRCEDVEERLRHALALRDVAVFTADASQSGPVLVVCAVVDPPFDGASALRTIAADVGAASFWRLDAIPRTPEGKVRRRALQRVLAAAVKRGAVAV